jgi:hypothetical protein
VEVHHRYGPESGVSVPKYYLRIPVLKNLSIYVPRLSLEQDFAAHVAEIRAMEAEQAASRRRLDDLFHSMLHRAFNGELYA